MGKNVFNITTFFISLFIVLSQQNSSDVYKKTWPIKQENYIVLGIIPNIKNDDIKFNLSSNQILNIEKNNSYNANRLEVNYVGEINPHYIHRRAQRKIYTSFIPFALYEKPKKNSFLRIEEEEEECIPNSSDEFPTDLFTDEQKKHGAVVLHFILGVYCFTLLAVVCNDYFLPSVELICESFNLSQDVAAATFMAIATSAPEFFVNVVGTFVTKSDIGVGTVVGSAMFNTLGVAALGGLAASKPIKIHWWPLTRDSIIYVLVLLMLISMCNDGKIQWYEAMILLICYFLYFFIMWFNNHIKVFVKKIYKTCQKSKLARAPQMNGGQSSSVMSISTIQTVITQNDVENSCTEHPNTQINEEESLADFIEEPFNTLWKIPETSTINKIWFIYSWPIRLLLFCTIPDCRRHPKLFPITFLMCVAWIGSNSYLVSWMITVIGDTLGVPDFVMGLTFLAAGGCLPEAISIVIVCRKGHGGMGVSNSLGANTLDILLCLGLPWFIKVMVNEQEPIRLGTGSLFFTITALLLAVFSLYVTLTLFKYRLNKKVGFILITIYIIFLTGAILLEMLWIDNENIIKPCEN